VKGNWVHVRLENGAEGWIRGAQLQPPQEVDDTEDAAAAVNFSTPNQEIKPFAGDWTPLKGKPSLFVFAQPNRAIPAAILGQSQFAFAKHIFTEGYREATPNSRCPASSSCFSAIKVALLPLLLSTFAAGGTARSPTKSSSNAARSTLRNHFVTPPQQRP
jgi:hypothetical protein